jgi:hypothetical protein
MRVVDHSQRSTIRSAFVLLDCAIGKLDGAGDADAFVVAGVE